MNTRVSFFIITIALSVFALSCKTVDMERRVQDTGIHRSFSEAELLEIPADILWPRPERPEPEVIIIERPVYIPENTPAPPTPEVRGAQAVRHSNAEGIMPPSEFSYAAMIYDFHPDWVYQIYTRPSRISAVRLEAGERVIDSPFVSDSERWVLGAGVSYENGIAVQHIYVKPSQSSLQATLIINTDRRVYHIILKSFNDIHMPMVRWRYPSIGLPAIFIQPQPAAVPPSGERSGNDPPDINLDPRFLSFDYRVTHSFFRKPSWFPELVFDNGRQSYVVFPKGVLQASMPAVFDDRSNVVNYRVFEHIIILDRLIEKATIRLDGRQAVIEKRRRR